MPSFMNFCRPFLQRPGFLFLTLVSASFFVSLGFWQLARMDEKKAMQAHFQQQETLPHQPYQLGSHPKAYTKLTLEGKLLPYVFLLDNQFYQHQLGYDVLRPMRLSDGQVVLVDFGFVSSHQHQSLPEVEALDEEVTLQGYAYYPSSRTWLLGRLFEKKRNDLVIIEQIDVKWLSKFLHNAVYPFIIRLDKNAPIGYIREWPIVAMSPDRHLGYAIQWFSFALVAIGLFVGLTLKNRK